MTAERVHERLRQRAREDDPRRVLALADVAAWARAEGEGSPLEAEALRRRGLEARIPGLAARPTVIVMGWAIFAAVLAAGTLSWLPKRPWIEAAGNLATFGACAAAVGAAAWGILSEVRGWEGSDASRWLLKRRVKAWRTVLEARRHEIHDTLLAIGDDAVVVYTFEDEAIRARIHPLSTVAAISFEPQSSGTGVVGYLSLRLTTTTDAMRFDWLHEDPLLGASLARCAAAVRVQHADAPARVA